MTKEEQLRLVFKKGIMTTINLVRTGYISFENEADYIIEFTNKLITEVKIRTKI